MSSKSATAMSAKSTSFVFKQAEQPSETIVGREGSPIRSFPVSSASAITIGSASIALPPAQSPLVSSRESPVPAQPAHLSSAGQVIRSWSWQSQNAAIRSPPVVAAGNATALPTSWSSRSVVHSGAPQGSPVHVRVSPPTGQGSGHYPPGQGSGHFRPASSPPAGQGSGHFPPGQGSGHFPPGQGSCHFRPASPGPAAGIAAGITSALSSTSPPRRTKSPPQVTRLISPISWRASCPAQPLSRNLRTCRPSGSPAARPASKGSSLNVASATTPAFDTLEEQVASLLAPIREELTLAIGSTSRKMEELDKRITDEATERSALAAQVLERETTMFHALKEEKCMRIEAGKEFSQHLEELASVVEQGHRTEIEAFESFADSLGLRVQERFEVDLKLEKVASDARHAAEKETKLRELAQESMSARLEDLAVALEKIQSQLRTECEHVVLEDVSLNNSCQAHEEELELLPLHNSWQTREGGTAETREPDDPEEFMHVRIARIAEQYMIALECEMKKQAAVLFTLMDRLGKLGGTIAANEVRRIKKQLGGEEAEEIVEKVNLSDDVDEEDDWLVRFTEKFEKSTMPSPKVTAKEAPECDTNRDVNRSTWLSTIVEEKATASVTSSPAGTVDGLRAEKIEKRDLIEGPPVWPRVFLPPNGVSELPSTQPPTI